MYVCVYVYIYIYIYTHMHTHPSYLYMHYSPRSSTGAAAAGGALPAPSAVARRKYYARALSAVANTCIILLPRIIFAPHIFARHIICAYYSRRIMPSAVARAENNMRYYYHYYNYAVSYSCSWYYMRHRGMKHSRQTL